MPKKRAPLLNLAERELIEQCLKAGEKINTIAKKLGRNRKTISREVNKNGGRNIYSASVAQNTIDDFTKQRITRIKSINEQYQGKCAMYRRAFNLELRIKVKELLDKGLSSRVISEMISTPKSTLLREINKNGGREVYDPYKAQKRSDELLLYLSKDNLDEMKKIEVLQMQIDILAEQVELLTKTTNKG